ncbi:GNAT family N-acetyltransferase [bacterium]|nr:GNAT family N-acetyltransferase [bacterium]
MTQPFHIKPVTDQDRAWIKYFIHQEWHADFIVAHKKIVYPDQMDGIIAWMENGKSGLVTYKIEDLSCEIITLNSLIPSIGIGTALMDAVKTLAAENQRTKVWLTTNDNLDALRFYQKRGFRIARIDHRSIAYARQFKSIPEIGETGIPIRDELELELRL